MEYHVDIGSAQFINSPKHLKVAHQTAARIGVPNKANNVAIFDTPNFRKYFVDIHGARYPRDDVTIDYASNDYLDQCRDFKLFYKEYVGEELLSPINYTDMKSIYHIQVIDLSFQVEHVSPKKFNYLRNIEVLLITLDCLLY